MSAPAVDDPDVTNPSSESTSASAPLTDRVVLFEPWHMGDVLIAASVLRLRPNAFALACQSRWHALLRRVVKEYGSQLMLLPVDLPYVNRDKTSRLDIGQVQKTWRVREVLSIRGDVRDRHAAKRIFPSCPVHVSGWLPFLARRVSMIDVPYRAGLFQVRNRYTAWASIAGLSERELTDSYGRHARNSTGRKVVIHVGAQWRSRQYPFVHVLRDLLMSEGHEVLVLAGPGDGLPSDLSEVDVARKLDGALVEALESADVVLANDSGPMHLAAFLGCATVVVSRMSNIDEWLPPRVTALRSPLMPRGYGPDRAYQSDRVVEGWPAPQEVLRALTESANAR